MPLGRVLEKGRRFAAECQRIFQLAPGSDWSYLQCTRNALMQILLLSVYIQVTGVVLQGFGFRRRLQRTHFKRPPSSRDPVLTNLIPEKLLRNFA